MYILVADKCLEFHGNQEVRGVSKDTGVRLVIVEWEMINVQCLTSGLEDGSLGSTDIEYCKPVPSIYSSARTELD